MPLFVLEVMEADYCIHLKKMGETILKIMDEAEVKGISPPEEVIAESRLSERAATNINAVRELGEKSLFACPDCGGGLWKIEITKSKHNRVQTVTHISKTIRQEKKIKPE